MLDATQMAPGDIIEFVSDQQTDKGPSSGTCIANDGATVTLSHSDINDDSFLISDLTVNYCRNRSKFGNAYWELA